MHQIGISHRGCELQNLEGDQVGGWVVRSVVSKKLGLGSVGYLLVEISDSFEIEGVMRMDDVRF